MRAVRVGRFGEPEDVVEIGEVEPPTPGPGEVLVRVAAGSLNFGDVARCRGGVAAVTPEPPFTLGMDMAGVVESAGEGLEEWVGRRVVGIAQQSLGGLAELAVAGTVFDAPPELDDEEAAAFTLPFHVSYLALHERAGLQDGETVLVRGGASAVGTAAIQLAKAAGARVIAVAGGPEKGQVCRELGADVVLDHRRDDLFAAVMDDTDDRGADVVFDPIGGEATEAIWTCAALGGRYLAVGFNDDAQSGMTGRPLRKVSMLNLTVMGVLLAYFDTPRAFRQFGINAFPPETGRRVHERLCELVASGAVRPQIGRRIGMDGVGRALADHAAGLTSGRTVVRIGPAA
ncbi:NADPH:quinone oxidoreductase family protein [Nocardioides sp.]|uniref:quinone oxidoreductase family protein n=1 Tax=Nocardioides sp. TaxID=35761 RepID=UPI001A1CDF4E|nr:NADPH:quinone oxidoreductase family protein [Nocardioides sp.]MBJ7358062.1 NADPH:quinone oxidoreductase family protein [Nocardioides sp.]